MAAEKLPYSEIDHWSLYDKVPAGYRPEIPEYLEERCPGFVELIKECWATEPALRPPILEIVNRLERLLLHKYARRWMMPARLAY